MNRPPTLHRGEAETLIGRMLPAYGFSERHAIRIDALPTVILDAALAYDPSRDPLIRVLIALRETPARLLARLVRRPTLPAIPFGLHSFLYLGRRSEAEIAFGLVGKFWRGDFGLVGVADAAAFRAFDRRGVAKLVLNFSVSEGRDGARTLTTETRLFAPDSASRRSIFPYWMLIRPVSGLIRRRMLRAIKKASERRPIEADCSSHSASPAIGAPSP